MSKKERLSDEVRRAVQDSGLSRYAICKEIGLDQAAMSRFILGKAGLGMKALDRLAVLLDLHIRKGK